MLHEYTNSAIIRVFVAHSWMAPAPDEQRNKGMVGNYEVRL